jgi:hypothetical protein
VQVHEACSVCMLWLLLLSLLSSFPPVLIDPIHCKLNTPTLPDQYARHMSDMSLLLDMPHISHMSHVRHVTHLCLCLQLTLCSDHHGQVVVEVGALKDTPARVPALGIGNMQGHTGRGMCMAQGYCKRVMSYATPEGAKDAQKPVALLQGMKCACPRCQKLRDRCTWLMALMKSTQ